MPRPHMVWRHVIINTLRSWLHGDERGFRSRGHRIHSSGDYRNPPPRGEHADLHRYQQERCGDEVVLPHPLRPVIGRAIIDYLLGEHYRLLTLAAGKVHTHFLVELPDDLVRVKWIVGQAKRCSSRAVKEELPGSIWAAGGTYRPVLSRGHVEKAYPYILFDQGPDAWTWSHRDAGRTGRFGRTRGG